MSDSRKLFTYGFYKEFLSRLLEEYSFITFREGKGAPDAPGSPRAILRHDIDMDPESALRMAVIEKGLGVSSTFFFLVRNPLYNIFSGRGTELAEGILQNGHHLGLHFDCALYKDITAANINDYIEKEVFLLESYFSGTVEAVSFHRPGRLELSGLDTAGLPNTYEKVFLEKFDYFSDSRGEWSRGIPTESASFTEGKNLHILAHPVWWTETPKTPYQCLAGIMERTGRQAEEYIAENCQVWNRDKPGPGKES